MKVTYIIVLVLALFFYLSLAREDETVTFLNHKGLFGEFGSWLWCDDGHYVTGFRIQVDGPGMGGWDQGMDRIEMGCRSLAGTFSNNITTQTDDRIGTFGRWGSWESVEGDDFFVGAKVKFQERPGFFEAFKGSAMNSVTMRSLKGVEKEPDNPGPHGKYTTFKSCPFGDAICGVSARLDDDDFIDATALNALNFSCCKLLNFEQLSMDFEDVNLSGVSVQPQILGTNVVNNPSEVEVVESISIDQPTTMPYTYYFYQTLTNFSIVEVEGVPIVFESSPPLKVSVKVGPSITISKTATYQVGVPIVYAVDSSLPIEASVEVCQSRSNFVGLSLR